MKIGLYILGLFLTHTVFSAPQFHHSPPDFHGQFDLNTGHLCSTAKHTLAYLNKGTAYDPKVIHGGKVASIPLARVKATLEFICQHQNQMNDPEFIKQHFEFIRWFPDTSRAKRLAARKPVLSNLPNNQILMTKYYVHLADAKTQASATTPYALYGLPAEEGHLTVEQANVRPELIRFKYGKQAILHGSLQNQKVPVLAYLSRDDLESALLQGTVVTDFGHRLGKKTFNVHRNNNKEYDRTKKPYEQERFWYFKEVDGIKGYGKDAEYKITIYPKVTFAADLNQFGLGKVLMIQYPDKAGSKVSRIGIFADTGGAFDDNLYQVDYLVGSYPGKEAFYKAVRGVPDYVDAYFMVLKSK